MIKWEGGNFFSLTFKMVHSEALKGSLQVHEKEGFIEMIFFFNFSKQ